LIGGKKEGSIEEKLSGTVQPAAPVFDILPCFYRTVPQNCGYAPPLVEMQSKFPEELLNFFENMEQRSNPWGIAPADRVKWAADLKLNHLKPVRRNIFSMSAVSALLTPAASR